MGRPIKKTYFGSVEGAGIGGEGISSIAVGGANAGYTEVPVLQIAAPDLAGGIQAVARAHMAVEGIVNFFAGNSGYEPGQVLTLVGGTGTQGTITVDATQVNTVSIGNSRGSGYAPGDVVTVDSGVGTSATITIVSTRVRSATVNVGGDGYAVDDIIEVNDGTSTTVKAQFKVTGIDGVGPTGPITTVAVVATAEGNYITNPTLIGSTTAKRSGAGNDLATLDLVMETNSISLVNGGNGSYTENPLLSGAATTAVAPATGLGLTVDLTMNIDLASVTTGGDYTALPADVSVVGHSGAGGALFNLTYKVLSADVVTAGSGYISAPVITEVPDGGATYTVSMTAVTANAIAVVANVTGAGAKAGDIVKQEASRRYLVTTGDGTGQCTLVAESPNAAGQMTMTAKDSAGGTYYVLKLTARRALIVKGDRTGVQFTTGTDGISVPWVFATSAVKDESVEIVSA